MAAPLKAFAGGGPAKKVATKWYSALEKALENADPGASWTFEKWNQWLHGRPGVKQEELDIVMPQVREMIGPNRQGPILKTDIQDLVKHVNAITPIEEFQSGNKISKDDLRFTRESSPLAMFREVMRSTPESALQFEAGISPQSTDPNRGQWIINAPGYGDGIMNVQGGANDFDVPLRRLESMYNNLNETRYPEFSKHRLPGGTNYRETVLGSPLSENMDIDSGHFGQVPGVGKNQISWALHHQREDGPMTPEMMAIPDEIEEAIEVETRKGLAGQARNAGEIGDIRHLAGTPGTTTRRAGTQAITMPNTPAPPTAPAARTARPEPDEGDPFGELDTLTGEIEQWSQDNGREWASADQMLHRAMVENWPQEQQDYLSAFIYRRDRARRVADGDEPAVPGWERNPDYNPNGPHHAIDNRRIRDPDPQQRLETAYTNHSEIVANGYAPDHTYFTYQGVGIGNPYADDMGDVLFNPPAYWELRGIPRRDVHRAMNDFLVRYQDPPDAPVVDDAGGVDWTPYDDAPMPEGQALPNQPAANQPVEVFDFPQEWGWGPPEDRVSAFYDDGNDTHAPYFYYDDVQINHPYFTEDGTEMIDRTEARDYWVSRGIDLDLVNNALEHWNMGVGRRDAGAGIADTDLPDPPAEVNIDPGAAAPNAIPQELQDAWTEARQDWVDAGGAEAETNMAFGNFQSLDEFIRHVDELTPEEYTDMMDGEVPAQLSDMIDEWRGLRDGRVEPDAPVAEARTPQEDYNIARTQAANSLADAEDLLREEFDRVIEDGGTVTQDTFEEFLADMDNQDWDNIDPDLGGAIRNYLDAQDAIMNARAPNAEPATPTPQAANPEAPRVRTLDRVREEMISAARREYGNTQEVNDSILDIANSENIDLAETGWPQELQDAANRYRIERRVAAIDFNDVPPGPHPEQMDQRRAPMADDVSLVRRLMDAQWNNGNNEYNFDAWLHAARMNDRADVFDTDTEFMTPEERAAAERVVFGGRTPIDELPTPDADPELSMTDDAVLRQAAYDAHGYEREAFDRWLTNWQNIRARYGDNEMDEFNRAWADRFDEDTESFSREARAIARRAVGIDPGPTFADPPPARTTGERWEVFDPQTGDPIASYGTEAEARRHANVNGRWDYARAGEGWSTEQKTKKVPNPNKPKGTKVTHIDELQSYRHQQGRGRGYRSEEEAYKKKKTELAEQLFGRNNDNALSWKDYQPLATNIPEDVWARDYAGWGRRSAADPGSDESVQRGRNKFMSEINGALSSDDPMSGLNRIQQKVGVDFAPEAIKHLIDKNKNLERLKKEYDAHVKIGNDKRFDTPDGPYKKSWPLLTLRRMLWQAAQDGSDYLTWNTSEAVQKHGTRKPIADSIYDKELPTVAKGELKRLGLSKDDLTQIKLGPKNNLGLSKEEIRHLEDIGDEDIMTEAIDVADYISSGNSKLRNSIMNLLSYDQKQKVDSLIIRHRKAVKRLDEGDEDDDDFEAVTDASVDLVNYLRETGIHERILDRKPNAWAIRLTPEIREKILKEGFPKFAAVGLPASEVEEFFADEENNDQRIK